MAILPEVCMDGRKRSQGLCENIRLAEGVTILAYYMVMGRLDITIE